MKLPRQKKKWPKLQQEARRYELEYKTQIEEANNAQQKFLQENTRVMDALQHLDSSRAQLLQLHLAEFFQIQERAPEELATELQGLRDVSALLSYDEDVSAFIARNRTSSLYPQAITFESYDVASKIENSTKPTKSSWLQKNQA